MIRLGDQSRPIWLALLEVLDHDQVRACAGGTADGNSPPWRVMRSGTPPEYAQCDTQSVPHNRFGTARTR